jgi:type I restriction enzyme R subunit
VPQIGLTATPKRNENIDTYDYFGDPVYVYSQKDGINDGYLTPFKVQQIHTTIDEYTFTNDDIVIGGEIEEGKLYDEGDFNQTIEIRERERHRVALLMDQIDQSQKTLVFCRNQEHALMIRDLINQRKKSTAVDYCVRVTADDGDIGNKHLRTFQDNEKTIPTILTTSHKLSTGVDARNIRNIVLMRPIKSMIEFKQIIGRGTRTFDNKDFFTVYDFVKAYHHFNDPEWDGEQVDPVPPKTPNPPRGQGEEPIVDDPPDPRPEKIRVKLAQGKELLIDHMIMTSYWTADGRPVSSDEFLRQLYGDLPDLFKNEQQLRGLWSTPDTRRHLLDQLRDRGYGPEQLAELARMINAENSDVYDVLAHIAYAAPTLTRAERASVHETKILSSHSEQMQEFLRFVLDQYVEEGVGELDGDKLPALIALKYATPHDAVAVLGDINGIRDAFIGFQKHLYEDDAVA